MKEKNHRAMNTKSCQKDNKKSYVFIEYQDNSFDSLKQVKLICLACPV